MSEVQPPLRYRGQRQFFLKSRRTYFSDSPLIAQDLMLLINTSSYCSALRGIPRLDFKLRTKLNDHEKVTGQNR